MNEVADSPDNCLFCGGAVQYGGGIFVWGRFICRSCELMLINTSSDNIFYDLYVNGLKKIWRCTLD